ncbi:MAG: alpha/beta fold hydrolase [Flavobacteriaceae bacterium]|nr:alpha/beta fold hydrolase [Flavobacteriaceae bacterium]
MTSNEWKSKGNFLQVNNNRLFVIDTNNDSNKSQKSMVVLHGYPTSSLDYYKVLPELSKSYRVILHDHLGFGFSDKPKNVDYSLVKINFSIFISNSFAL